MHYLFTCVERDDESWRERQGKKKVALLEARRHFTRALLSQLRARSLSFRVEWRGIHTTHAAERERERAGILSIK